MKSIYILSTNFGQFLANVTVSGGCLIFSYTNNFYEAMQMDKNKADFYSSIKNFFIKIKLA